MGKRGFFAILIISTIISLCVFCILFFLTNPFTASWSVILFFYIDMVVFLTSVVAIFLMSIRSNLNKGKTNFLPFASSLRQGFLVSIAATGILLLKAGRILNPWDGALLILAVILIEFYYKK
jgi:hypothetical protein